MYKKDFSEINSKLGYCLNQVVPMADKIEQLSRNVFECKEECRKQEHQIITKAEKDDLLQVDGRLAYLISLCNRFKEYTTSEEFRRLEQDVLN